MSGSGREARGADGGSRVDSVAWSLTSAQEAE